MMTLAEFSERSWDRMPMLPTGTISTLIRRGIAADRIAASLALAKGLPLLKDWPLSKGSLLPKGSPLPKDRALPKRRDRHQRYGPDTCLSGRNDNPHVKILGNTSRNTHPPDGPRKNRADQPTVLEHGQRLLQTGHR